MVVEYVDEKRKEFERDGLDPGAIWDFVFCCMSCCLWCLEKCMRWINKNVYIETILWNISFCSGESNHVQCFDTCSAVPLSSRFLFSMFVEFS